ncbi:MAG TPA: response regulator transcription factor [Anaerolineales bacterium]|nr:response regulator transcription factor [Anaerolineales bacterium]
MAAILVVEDHPAFSQSIVRLLKSRSGFEVTAVQSAEQAVDQLPGLSVNLVLIDISLPGMSGIRLIESVREIKPGLPCLMLSGHVTPSYVEQSMAAGARGYILKDDIPGIFEGIKEVLSGGTFISEALHKPQ